MTVPSPTADQLVAELHRLGIRHLATTTPATPSAPLGPQRLLTGLAASPDARVRAALVPLFLWHPDLADVVRAAAAELSGHARVYLQCSYSAAVALEHRMADPAVAHEHRGEPELRDHFAADLGLNRHASTEVRLAEIARRHAQLSGEAIDWRGTYEHALAAALRFAEPVPAWHP